MFQTIETLPSFANYHPVDEDRQKGMVAPTAAGLTPPRVQGQTDDDFRGELQRGEYGITRDEKKERHTIVSPGNLFCCRPPHDNSAICELMCRI